MTATNLGERIVVMHPGDGAAPQVLAALRNMAFTCLRRLGFKPVEGIGRFAEHRYQALDLDLNGRTE
jgi:hypothetical protein